MKRKEKKIKNIMTDLIPYEITIYDEKDPAKTKNRIKKLIHERTSIYKDYLKNTQVFEKLTLIQNTFYSKLSEN